MGSSDSDGNLLRLFVAIPVRLPDFLQREIYTLKDRLTTYRIRWVDPLQYHITLCFLGETESSYLLPITRGLRKIATGHDAFRLGWDGVSFVGKRGRPGILWLETEKSDPIRHLQADIAYYLNRLGIYATNLRFSPHVTLARVHRNTRLPADFLNNFTLRASDKEMAIRSFTLIKSLLHPEGSQYTLLETFTMRS